MGFINWLKEAFALSFNIDLDDEYAFKFGKNFIYPNDLVICTAIEKYAIKSGQKIDILSRTSPIRIMINDKDIYKVILYYSGHRVQCYSLKCKKIN